MQQDNVPFAVIQETKTIKQDINQDTNVQFAALPFTTNRCFRVHQTVLNF